MPANAPVMVVVAVVVRVPILALAEKRLVDDAVVEKKLVVVALVPVALRKVKFCRVDEPFDKRLAKVPSPVDVKLPPFPVLKKMLVEEAVVEKKLVVVADVPVADPNENSVKLPCGPDMVELVRFALENVPPSVRRVSTELPCSISDELCLVTVGRVSASNIDSRRTVVL